MWQLGSEPDTLNHLTATDAYESRINSFVFDSLIERDNETLEWKPKLASSWEVSDNKMQFTFHLRRDVKWHDGKPFTADDVIYSFDRIQDPKVDAPHLRVYYKDIKKLEKVDDYTIRFTYAKPYFKALVFCGEIPIIPKHIFDDGSDFNKNPAGRHPIGTGPYRFLRWDTGKKIVLEKNTDYWDAHKMPGLQQIVFKIISEDSVALQELKKGEVDLAGLRPIQWVRQTDSKKFNRDFVKHEYYAPGYRFIGWNLKNPLFQDAKVRRALTQLIDRQSIVDKLEFGLGKVISGPFFFQGYEYNQTIPPLPYDPEDSKKLLEEAGWEKSNESGLLEKEFEVEEEGKKIKKKMSFQFTFLIPSGARFYERLATLMKEDFKKVGIEMKIRTMEWAAFIGRINKRDFEATALGWSAGFDEDPYQVWHSSQAKQGSNFVGFENKEADEIMEEARKTFNQDRRAKLYHRFHEIIADEQPYTFLYTGESLIARSARFKNVKVYRTGLDPIEWKLTE
ncbi:MAG: peptide-binding protein [Deltaproteobacteria bacterium]|nr:peptide-binding protein [Deltaproteobacteria bacterium]